MFVFGFKIKHSDNYCSEVGSKLTMLLNEPFCDFDLKGFIVVCTLLKCLISMCFTKLHHAFPFNNTVIYRAGLSGHRFIEVIHIDSHQVKC